MKEQDSQEEVKEKKIRNREPAKYFVEIEAGMTKLRDGTNVMARTLVAGPYQSPADAVKYINENAAEGDEHIVVRELGRYKIETVTKKRISVSR